MPNCARRRRIWERSAQVLLTDSNAVPTQVITNVRFRLPSPVVSWVFRVFWKMDVSGLWVSAVGTTTNTWSLYPLGKAPDGVELRGTPVFEGRSFAAQSYGDFWEGAGPVRAYEAEITWNAPANALTGWVSLEAQPNLELSDEWWDELYGEIGLEVPTAQKIDLSGG